MREWFELGCGLLIEISYSFIEQAYYYIQLGILFMMHSKEISDALGN